MVRYLGGILLSCLLHSIVFSQIRSFPYTESFDSVEVPFLPHGWQTSVNRLASGDFFSTRTSPRSTPHAVQSTNSTIAQSLLSPRFDFSEQTPESLRFFIARSATHIAPLLLEISTDDGETFFSAGSDTLFNPGTTSYVRTDIDLPDSLRGHSSVRFRWRTFGGSGGTTGTLRIDDITLTTVITNDLALERFVIDPPLPVKDGPLTVAVVVKNRGVRISPEFGVDFQFQMVNGVERRSASLEGSTLAPGDSVELTLHPEPLSAGTWKVTAGLSFPDDERRENDTLSALIDVGFPPGSIVINEIMYAPTGDEPEWIELSNISHDSMDLRGWKISDSNLSAAAGISTLPFVVPPMGYALIAKDSALFSVRQIPDVPVRIVNFAALNNTTPDAVVVKDHRGLTMDSVPYSPDWGGRGGPSLERIDPLEPSVDRSNWGSSMDSTGATPGARNSIARFDHDLELVSATAEATTIVTQVRNAGKITAGPFEIEFRKAEEENAPAFGSVRYSSSLIPGSVIFLQYEWEDAPSGETHVAVSVVAGNDQRPENNRKIVPVVRSFRPAEIVLNEILYEPIGGQNEWIELFHRGDGSVDLAGWTFEDRPTLSGNRNSFRISSSSHSVLPGEFVVIAAESTILNLFPSLMHAQHVLILNRAGGFSFGNDGDDIILKDLLGTTIDSVRYSPQQHHPDVTDARGRSLERIHADGNSNDPRNWSTSAHAAGGSPGIRNTVSIEKTVSHATLSFSPNPFSPDGDGIEDFCVIQYNLPHQTSLIRLRIFDRTGRLIMTLADGEPSGAQGERIWNGFDDSSRRARIGPYIALLEALDRSGGILVTAKGVIVVATKL